MNTLPNLPAQGQVISHLFDFSNRVKSVNLKNDKSYTRAPKSDMAFNPLELWDFIGNPSAKIEEKGLILLKAPAYKPGSTLIEVTDQLLKHLPEPWIESIKFVLVTAAFPSQKEDVIRELRGVFVLHFLEPPYVADVRDGILITWPENYEGKDFQNKVKYHRLTPVTPKPKQKPEPVKYPPLRVVPDPKPSKPDRRKKKKAPPDVLNYFSWLAPKSSWEVVFKAMYKEGFYEDIKKNKFYQGKHSHLGRFYTWGIKRLVAVTGLSDKTIKKCLALMLKNNIIRRWKGGFPGQGNSFYELPKDLSHVMAWKRKPKTRAKQTGKR